jgi:hypothetical protein
VGFPIVFRETMLDNQVSNLTGSAPEILPIHGYYVGQAICEFWIGESSLASRCVHVDVSFASIAPPFAHSGFVSERQAPWEYNRLTEKTLLIWAATFRHSGYSY